MEHFEGPDNPRAPPRIMEISHILRNAFEKRTRIGICSRINGIGLSSTLPRILHDSNLCKKGSNEIVFIAGSYVQARLLCGQHRREVMDNVKNRIVHETEIDGCRMDGKLKPFVTYTTSKMLMRRLLKNPESLNDSTIIIDDLEKKDLRMDSILISLHLMSSASFKDKVKFNLILLSTGRDVTNLLELFASDGSHDVDILERIDQVHGHVEVVQGNLLYYLNGGSMQMNTLEMEQKHFVMNEKECEFSERSYHHIMHYLGNFAKRDIKGAIFVSLPNIEYVCKLREFMRRSDFLKSLKTYESYHGKGHAMFDELRGHCTSPQGLIIILDTGLAETIHIPNLIAVIDSGLVQRYYFDPPYNYERPQIELASVTDLDHRANFSPSQTNHRTYVNLAQQYRHQAPMVNPDESPVRDLGLAILQLSKMTRVYRIIPFNEIFGIVGQNPSPEHIKGNISKQKARGTIMRDDADNEVFITQFGIRVRHLDLPVDVGFAILVGKALGIKDAAAKIAFLSANGGFPISRIEGLRNSFRYNDQLCRPPLFFNFPSSSDQIYILEKYTEWKAHRAADPSGLAQRQFLNYFFIIESIFKSTSAGLSMLKKRFPRLLTGVLGNSFTIYRGDVEESVEAFQFRIRARNQMIMVLEAIKHFPHFAVIRQGVNISQNSEHSVDASCSTMTCPPGILYPEPALKTELAKCRQAVQHVSHENYYVRVRFAEEPLCGGVHRGVRGLERIRLANIAIRHNDIIFHPFQHPYVLDILIAKGVYDILRCNPNGHFLETETRVDVERESINATIINDFPRASKIGGGVLVGSKVIYNPPNCDQPGTITLGGTTLLRARTPGLLYRLLLLTAPKIELITGQNGFILGGIGSNPTGGRIDSTFDLAIPNEEVPPHMTQWALNAHTIRMYLNRIMSKEEKDYETVRILRGMLLSFIEDEESSEVLPLMPFGENFEQINMDELAYPFNSIPFPQ